MYNNAIYIITKETLFFTNYRYNPTIIRELLGKYLVVELSRLLANRLK